MKTDKEATVADLKQTVAEFVKERGWEHYHSPKNLSMSIAIEAAELMEHFQWRTPEEARQLLADKAVKKEISHEIADIASYILSFCNLFDIDLASALTEKMEKNADKYPANKARSGILPL